MHRRNITSRLFHVIRIPPKPQNNDSMWKQLEEHNVYVSFIKE